MSAKMFIDTNVLIYAYFYDTPEKTALANRVIQGTQVYLSTQVLLEFSNITRKKYGRSWQEISKAIEELTANFNIYVNTQNTILLATQIAERYGFSIFDSLIVAAALESDCTILYSEDLQHQQMIEGKLQVVNPFL